jgi:hypothetical protein
MKKYYLLLLLLTATIISHAQSGVYPIEASTVEIRKRDGSDALLRILGILQVRTMPLGNSTMPLVVWDSATKQFKRLPKDSLGVTSTVTNGLVHVDSIRATGTLEVTIFATTLTPAVWRISSVNYSFNRDSVFAITAATDGYFRKDIIVGNASGSYQLIQGVEATTTAVQPATPTGTVLITVVDISGASVSPPAPDLSGYAQLNADNTYTGLNDFYGETNFRWITNFYSSAFRFKNQANSNTSTITWPTDGNYLWAYPNVTGRIASIKDTLNNLASRWRLDSSNAAINAKPNFGDVRDISKDTADVLRAKILADSIQAASVSAGKVNISDTASMLSGYRDASILNAGTVADARLSSNVNLLDAAQTITANKVSTGLTTARANGLAATQDLTKGLFLQNQTASTVGVPQQISPAIVWQSNAWNTGGTGGGLAVGNNEFYWRVEQRATSGNGATGTDNKLVFMQKYGTNAWVDRVEFNRDGIVAPISGNTITLGTVGASGSLTLRRSSNGGVVGSAAASSGGITFLSGSAGINVLNSTYTGFTDNPNFGMRYTNASGLYVTTAGNSSATPLSRLVVDANASIGANVAAPTNGLQVAGESIFTSTRTAYTATGVDLTLSAAHNVVALTATGLTITLPTAVGITGRSYTIINESSGSNTIATTSTQLIGNFNTATTYTLPSDGGITIVSNGTKWVIKSKF